MDETLPVIEGLRLIERTQESGPGEVWRARIVGGLGGAAGERLPGELAGVGECDVRLLRLPVEPAIRARAHSVAADLVGLEDAGLVIVREVRMAYDGIALILASLPSPMLALHLLARRRQLSAGEVVTLGVAVSWALAAAHAAGVTHGRLRDGDVLIDPGGRPMLAGVGVMGVLGSAGDPADDVRGLARMLLSLLDSQSPGATRVSRCLAQGLAAATDLAAGLAAACPASPIQLTEGAVPAPPRPARGRRGSRRDRAPLGGLLAGVLGGGPGTLFTAVSSRLFGTVRKDGHWRRVSRLAVVGAGILVLAGVIGWVSAPGPPASSVTAPIAKPAVDWPAVLTALDSTRAQAFAVPGTVAGTAFDAADTAALRYDTAAIASLRRQGAHAVGLRMLLASVSVQRLTSSEVTLVVTDTRSAYNVLNAQQTVLSRVPGRAAARHLIVLRSSGPDQWRIAEISADSSAATSRARPGARQGAQGG